MACCDFQKDLQSVLHKSSCGVLLSKLDPHLEGHEIVQAPDASITTSPEHILQSLLDLLVIQLGLKLLKIRLSNIIGQSGI